MIRGRKVGGVRRRMVMVVKKRVVRTREMRQGV